MKFKTILAGMVLAAATAVTLPAAVDIGVRIGPPRAVVEHRPPPPGAGYVWINGYQNWNGNAYVWVPGRWDRPPREHQRWVADRWVHHKDGWHRQEGHWR